MTYEEALRSARNGNAVLFFGAGFSRGLKSISQKKLPSGSELAEILCKDAGIKITKDLTRASRQYLKYKTTEDLIRLLKDYFLIDNVPESYDGIFKCPWRQVYTTNYDNAFEVGSKSNQDVYISVDATEIPRNTANQKRVIHINGFINTVNTENINTSFKLTNSSYLTEHFRNSAWSEVFKRDINSAHAVFFVGYSLYDIDIQEILYASAELKDKTFFIEREDISNEEIEDLYLDEFGTVINKGIVNFSMDLNNVDNLSLDEEELIVTSFYQPIYSNKNKDVHDSSIFDLLLNGNLDDELLYNDLISEKYNYCILRESFKSIVAEFDAKENLLVHSGLANGKTVFTKQVSMILYNKGYTVFELNDDYLESYAYNEINKILEKYDKVLFLIENYATNLSVVDHINSNRRANTKIILISRSYEHERIEDELYYSKNIIDIGNTLEIPLDKLSSEDIRNISGYFDLYGLWGKKYGQSYNQKSKFLEKTASAEFHGILLGLFDSPQIKEKLSVYFEEMRLSNTILINIVAILTLSMANVAKPSFHMISALTNTNEIFEKSFRSSEVFKQLISGINDSVVAKSSVLAEYLLTNFPIPPLLVDTLVSIAKNARAKGKGNPFYFSLYKDLASFRYIQRMLPKKGKRESLILFYQGLKDIPEERNNPHFWLQYAIARLSYPDEDNLLHAKSYLDNAMSLALKRKNYWTDDIETQLARYYFEKSLLENEENINLAFEHFETGIKLIIKIYRNNNRPRKELFRPLKMVDNFYMKYKSALPLHKINTIEDQLSILDSYISKSDAKYNEDIRFRMARDAIKNVLDDIRFKKHISNNS